MSLPYFGAFGWRPIVLAVDPSFVEFVEEPRLLETIPSDIPIRRVPALPVWLTRKVRFSDVGLRAWAYLYRAGAQLIKQYHVDLVYFSTTMFLTMPLGRVWKARFGVPYVLDMQDPWAGNYYQHKPRSERPPKYGLARHVHRLLEPWTMRQVGGIVAVTAAYHHDLRSRYPWIRPDLCTTVPFGATERDFEVARTVECTNAYFHPRDGLVHGVFVGVLGKAKQQVGTAICLALRKGLEQYPEQFSRIRLHFIGTDYAPAAKATATILPIAISMGLEEYIQEDTHRIPYFAALNLLRDADFLLVLGSDNPQYTASKIYPYILARKPLLAFFHKQSSVVEVLRSTRAGEVAAFSSGDDVETMAGLLTSTWISLLRRLPYMPDTDWAAFEPYTAREMTRRQCDLFDRVLQVRAL